MKNQLVNTTINEQIIKELYHINYLVAFPLSDLMLEGWAKSIQELAPELTPERLKKIINGMKVGVVNYDTKKGIQNIFLAHKPVNTNTVTRVEIKPFKELKND